MKYNLNKKYGAIISGLVIAILMLGVFLYKEGARDSIDSNIVKWEQEKNEDPERIKIPGYSKLTIPSSSKEVSITLGNPQGNKCYFKFEIIIEDEILYTSELVEAGYAIKTLELSKELEKGSYDAVIKITPYSLDKKSEYIGANVKTTIEAV